MKNLILFGLMLIGAAIQAQKLNLFEGENGKFGYKSSTGDIIVPSKYDKGESTFHQKYPAVTLNNKIGFINSEGIEIISCNYDSTTSFDHEGKIAMVKLKDNWGGIDTNGRQIIPFIYQSSSGKAYTIKEWPRQTINSKYITSVLGVKKDGKWGLIDISGKEITSFKYESVDNAYSSDPFFFAKFNGKWGIIDILEKEVFPFVIDSVVEYGQLNDEKVYYRVKINGKEKKIILNQKTKQFIK